MLNDLKQEWSELKKGRPGHRFRERCERNRRARADKSAMRRFVVPVLGVVLLALGLVFCVIPGPGLPLVAIGGGLLAQHSMAVAVAMDWLEVKIRYIFSRLVAWWQQASLAAKNVVMLLAALAITAVGYGAYHFMFRH